MPANRLKKLPQNKIGHVKMNCIIRAASRLAPRKILDVAAIKQPIINQNYFLVNKRWAHNQPLTYDFVRERIMLVLRLYDKVDPYKVTLDSHFVNDLGLDSLDHVEIIMEIENEFKFDIPDKDAEKLVTPRDILMYITDHEEAYEELQRLEQAHHGHHEGEHGHASHGEESHHNHASAGSHQANNSSQPQTRGFCTSAFRRNEDIPGGKKDVLTSFMAIKPKDVNFDDIQARVMKVCSKYDKIDSSKLDAASHFVQDLGLDSLDHIEIMMELEDEFGLEIPDTEAEKLMRPTEVARYIFAQEEKRAMNPEDRPF